MVTPMANELTRIDLAEIRLAAGLTQVALAQRWGKSQRAVSSAETDMTDWRLSTLVAYLRAAGAETTLSIRVADKEYVYELS